MNREKTLLKAFQRGHLLNLKNTTYKSWIKKFIIDETRGDIGAKGDITSNSVIKKNKRLKAKVITREPGIIAGLEEVAFLYKNNGINVNLIKKDGQEIKKGDKILELTGKEKDLLRIERSALDLMQRMSGIATLTHNLLKKIKNKAMLAPTRKTQWRYLDKKSVYVGKGLTHRLALWDAILIKDNHLKALEREGAKNPIKLSLERAWKHRKSANFIEIEVTNESEALDTASVISKLNKKEKTPCLIMLDNMSPKEIKKTIKSLKEHNLYCSVLIEASGNISPGNIKAYSKTGVDVISMGYLTHSSHALDIKQHIM